MKNRKYDLAAFMMAVLVGAAVLFGCGEPSGAVSKEEPLTVYCELFIKVTLKPF